MTEQRWLRQCLGLRYRTGQLEILDQTRLPLEEHWICARDPDAMLQHIQRLRIRGAPALGVSAALSLACAWHDGLRGEAFVAAANQLRQARPTAVNLMHAVDRVLACLPSGNVEAEVLAIFDEDNRRCQQLARHGAPLLKAGQTVLTICNTGGLATAGSGTAAAVIIAAHSQHPVQVLALETRPLLQGGRLTTWEFQKLGVPVTLIADGMTSWAMASGRVDHVLVGADRIARNGDFANKIGTLSVAVQALHYGIPFHVVAPMTTVDPRALTGADIPIELRAAAELRQGPAGVPWVQEDIDVLNPAFDVTPCELVTGLVTDCGVFSRQELHEGVLTGLT